MLFNFLIGNTDAHGKNISLLLTEKGPMLAPFYDLMSTAVYAELAQRHAMRIGGEDRPDWIIERRWQAFAEEVGIGYKLVRQTLLEMKEQVSEEAAALAADFEKAYGKVGIIGKILSIIEQRKNKIANMLAAGDKK